MRSEVNITKSNERVKNKGTQPILAAGILVTSMLAWEEKESKTL